METLIGEGMFTIGKKIGSGAFGVVYEGNTQQACIDLRVRKLERW